MEVLRVGLYTDPNYFEKQASHQGRKRSKVVESIKGHFIRPCYLHESETPLKFYKLIARIGLPLGFILNLFRAMQATTAIGTATEAAKPYFIIDAVYMWVGIILVLGAVIGLNKMEWYGVKCYASLFSWSIAFNAFLAIYSSSLGLYEFEYFGRSIFAIVYLSIWLYFCMVYFGKRRLLFSPGAFETPRVADEAKTEPEKVSPVQPEPTPVLQEAPPVPAVELPPTVQGSPPADLVAVKKPKHKPHVLTIVLCIALVLSLAGNIWQGVSWASDSAESAENIRVLNNKLTQKEEAISEYRTKVGDLNTELARVNIQKERLYDHLDAALFLYNNIGFIVNGSSYYHNYECPVFQAASEYWAHNIEYCQSIGYGACPVCWD